MANNTIDKINEKLIAQGWNISPAGLTIITDNENNKDFKSVLQNALNSEIKDIGKYTLTDALTKKKINNIVLQIQKIRNVSAPKANEESQHAPRMLKLTLTDGKNYCQGIESESIPGLSLQKTPPGSKILLTNATIMSGYIILNTSTCTYLGGKVMALFEKWEFNKNMIQQKRGDVDGDGPPPWVNFGKKITGFIEGPGFKSIEVKTKDDKSTEFDAQRQGAIAEAASGAVKKVFGGGNKPLTSEENKRDYDHNRRDYPSKRDYDNNRDSIDNERKNYDKKRDNYDNKRENYDNKRDNYDNKREFDNKRERKPQEGRERGGGGGGRRGRREPRDGEDSMQKPPEKVSLFDFLEDKLPVSNAPALQEYTPKNDYYDKNKATYNNYNENKSNYNKSNQYNKSNKSNYNKPNQFNKPNEYSKPKQNEYNTFDNKQFPKPFEKSEKAPYFNEIKSTPAQNVDTLTNNFNKMNMNAPFAMKAFKQHLNLPEFKPKHDSTKFNQPKPHINEPQKQFKNNNFGVYQENDFGGPKMNQVQDFGGPRPTFFHSNRNVKPSDFEARWQWKIGDQCMAKYWEDNKYYNASITAVTERTCAVQFNEYGNLEEVLFEHCIPITSDEFEAPLFDNHSLNKKPMDFRRGGNKPFPKKY